MFGDDYQLPSFEKGVTFIPLTGSEHIRPPVKYNPLSLAQQCRTSPAIHVHCYCCCQAAASSHYSSAPHTTMSAPHSTNTPPAKQQDAKKPTPPSFRVLQQQDVKQEKISTPVKAEKPSYLVSFPIAIAPTTATVTPKSPKRAADIAHRRRQRPRAHCKYCKASPFA
jgi:hypothetical protein